MRPRYTEFRELNMSHTTDERNMGRVVLHDTDGILVSADVDLIRMTTPNMPTDTAALILDTLHPKVVLTGLGIKWAQTASFVTELHGVHFKPVYLEFMLDHPLRLTLADYISAEADFINRDPQRDSKVPLGLVLRVVTPHGPILIDPRVQLQLLGSLQVFRLQDASPMLVEAGVF